MDEEEEEEQRSPGTPRLASLRSPGIARLASLRSHGTAHLGSISSTLFALLALCVSVAHCAPEPQWPPCPLLVGPSPPPDENDEQISSRMFDFNITHPIFSIEAELVTFINYQVAVWVGSEVSEWSLHVPGYQPHCTHDPLQWIPKYSGNHTIRALFKIYGQEEVYEVSKTYNVSQDCEVALAEGEGSLSWKTLGSRRCVVKLFGSGLLFTLTSLNIPCTRGGIYFAPEGPTLCGKLEELAQRTLHVPKAVWLSAPGPFSLTYKQVHECYNVTLVGSNGSAEIPPVGGLDCTFSLLLPWGYLVSLELLTTSASSSSQHRNAHKCQGVQIEAWEGNAWWGHCSEAHTEPTQLTLTSRTNKLILRVTSPPQVHPLPTLTIRYSARGERKIVGNCDYPAILSGSGDTCLILQETPVPWDDAEQACRSMGGHLASIRSQQDQTTIDNLLINSASYRESNAYWIGATDRLLEGDFRWSDTMPFSYTNWFPGWEGTVSRQPNDDGLSGQDCVELRRLYRIPPSITTLTQTFTWNDRDCSTQNYFLCETLPSGGDIKVWLMGNRVSWPECNRTVSLSWDSPRAMITSPDFPHPYPDNTVCVVKVTAPPLASITVEFEEFVLEAEPKCSYDYLELLVEDESPRRLCGDQSERLKLLRLTTKKPNLSLLFASDYSNHYTGFKAKVSIEHGRGGGCGGDERQVRYDGYCYLFVSYPDVTWQTAQNICQEIKGRLAVPENGNVDRFLTTKLRESRDYSTNGLYWLGAKLDPVLGWAWQPDKTPITFTGWPEGEKGQGAGDETCLSIQWVSRPGSSGLYWRPQHCDMVGGYICQIKDQDNTGVDLNVNRTEYASTGEMTSPLYPLRYPPDLDYEVRIQGPERSRIVYRLTDLDLEPQVNCLYDFLQIDDGERLCGHKDQNHISSLKFSSVGNIGVVRFRTDYSISGRGWRLEYKAVETSWCPSITLPASTGRLYSPNYPDYLLPNLDCSATILAPSGKRVVVEIEAWDVGGEAEVELWLGGGRLDRLCPYQQSELLSEGIYVSREERLLIRLSTGASPAGSGFSATFKTVGADWVEERQIILENSTNDGRLRHVNYPLEPPSNLRFVQRLSAPLGHTIHLDISPPHNSKLLVNEGCSEGADLEVKDSYAEPNGTTWLLCAVPLDHNTMPEQLAGPAALMDPSKTTIEQLENRVATPLVGSSLIVDSTPAVPEPLSIDSYLNSLTLTHVYTSRRRSAFPLNASLHVDKDEGYKAKLKGSVEVETCLPNPCLNGGKCTNSSGKARCQCTGHYTGLLCGLTLCELEPCVFGRCELTGTSGYRCHCKEGYLGEQCEKRQRPCASNPCDSRGECHETNDATFTCRCHAWWEGSRCERRMLHIPFKPLSERMLQEPFWLGLITVTIVLGILGLFWCAKRHFPEKLEKLLAEEDPNRPYMSSGRCSSMKERHQLTPSASVTSSSSAVAMCAPLPQQGKPRLLTRLRKPSLLLTPSGRQRNKTSRTFSLDDLLKPPPTNIPSPRKKRNNSTPIKKVSDKKEILQQLVRSRQASAESIAMSAKLSIDGSGIPSLVSNQASSGTDSAETSFTANNINNGESRPQSKTIPVPPVPVTKSLRGLDAKLEKKVTFARLLDRVSSEISSGSEVEIPRDIPTSTASKREIKVTSSPAVGGLGADSRSSSEVQLTTPGEGVSRKANSADSLLAMLRGLGGAASSSSSSTPTTTPREDAPDTPMSSSSGISDSPPVYIRRNTIQVAVVDPLNVVSCGGGGGMMSGSEQYLVPPTILLEVPNKCLSPIREVPTPVPSPALTPTLPRHNPMSLLAPMPYKPMMPKVVMGGPKEEIERPTNLVIPVVRVEEVQSPTKTFRMEEKLVRWGERAPLLKEVEKRGSVDMAVPPPLITVTCSDSEADSPPVPSHGLMPPPTNTAFLSPFSICSRQDRAPSESNLSSSGYSSMASPAPSRCGSNNPLCLTDVEDGGCKRRSGKIQEVPTLRRRSDSETYSENDVQSQSNDEGFTTDQKDEEKDKDKETSGEEFKEKIRGLIGLAPPPGGVKHCRSFDTGLERKSRKKTKVKQCSSVEAGLDGYRVTKDDPSKTCKVLLELPSIVVEGEDVVYNCSPVSSRSESPLSDKTGVGRFSPMFYGRLTDSDGLYDCGSSDTTKTSRKYGRRKERKRSKSPTKHQTLLDVPGKLEKGSRTKPSPKRRTRPKPMSSTSSSSGESINSIRDLSICLSPDKLAERYNKASNWMDQKSDPPQIEEVKTKMLPNNIKPKKISRLKSVGNQIRFLRRLEQSLKRSREGMGSPERPLLGKADNSERREKRMSWLRQRGAASDTLVINQGEDMTLLSGGHTD